jgi:hypothetical protein
LFRARNEINNSLGNLCLDGMRKGECYSVSKLPNDGFIDFVIPIAQAHSTQRTYEIYILISINIPSMAPLGTGSEEWRRPDRVLSSGLAKCLRRERND